MSKLIKTLKGRLGRNVLFWAIVAFFIATLNSSANDYPLKVYALYKTITTVLLFLLTCTNNFFLIPKTLAKKRYWLFFTGLIFELAIFSISYLLVLKQMVGMYADIEVYEVSIITSPVSTDWSFGAFFDEGISYAFGLLMWLAVFTLAWFANDRINKERIAKEAEKKRLEAELSLLRNQISPHFLFNTLNNIYGLTLKKSDVAPEAILKLSALMRYMLYESDEELVSFEKEQEAMQAYINMELLRLPEAEDKLKFTVEADKEYKIPTLLWLPMLENAFKYATRVISDNYFIDYTCKVEHGVLTIESSNSYKEDIPLEKGGLGLTNLRKRLSILYQDKYSIDEKRSNGVYTISVKIELD